MMSYFGRINYNYDSRYYLNATMRADGSSKFPKNNRWGYFPSASVAWAFGREALYRKMLLGCLMENYASATARQVTTVWATLTTWPN